MLTKIRVFAYTMKIYIIYKGGGGRRWNPPLHASKIASVISYLLCRGILNHIVPCVPFVPWASALLLNIILRKIQTTKPMYPLILMELYPSVSRCTLCTLCPLGISFLIENLTQKIQTTKPTYPLLWSCIYTLQYQSDRTTQCTLCTLDS